MLEKTLESPLDSKEIKPVNPKGDHAWIFIGRTDAEAEALILWLHLMRRPDSLKKILMLGKIDDKRRKGQQRMRWFYSISDSIGFPGGSAGKESICNKGNYKQGEKAAFRIGENNSKRSNWQTTNLKNIQATPADQFQKNKRPNQKMGQRTEQTFLQRRYTDD